MGAKKSILPLAEVAIITSANPFYAAHGQEMPVQKPKQELLNENKQKSPLEKKLEITQARQQLQEIFLGKDISKFNIRHLKKMLNAVDSLQKNLEKSSSEIAKALKSNFDSKRERIGENLSIEYHISGVVVVMCIFAIACGFKMLKIINEPEEVKGLF